jgi:Pterin 4 alpha carbinolamine dehydratase
VTGDAAWRAQVRNFKAGLELLRRIGDVAEAEGHHPDLHLTGWNNVSAELSTHSVGGCCGGLAGNLSAVGELPSMTDRQKLSGWAARPASHRDRQVGEWPERALRLARVGELPVPVGACVPRAPPGKGFCVHRSDGAPDNSAECG